MTKVVVAPDALKGSASAVEAVEAIAQGIRLAHPTAEVIGHPVSDGGEGFLASFVRNIDGETVQVDVTGPDGNAVTAKYWRDDRRAVIELAEAAGLLLTKRHDIRRATTFGVGQLLKDAMANGARDIVIGLGGSATVDGGLGLLRALGAEFFDADGGPIETAAGLRRLQTANVDAAVAGLADVVIQVAVDVEQPLEGCAEIFGPQKGATAHDVDVMEEALQRLAAVVDPNGLHATKAGTGAAGGVGFALSLVGARLCPGVDVVLDAIAFDASLAGATLCVSAEGRVDAQSLQGKATLGVARRAEAANVPCIVIAGQVSADLDDTTLPFEIEALHQGAARSDEDARATVLDDLRRAGERIARRLDAR